MSPGARDGVWRICAPAPTESWPRPCGRQRTWVLSGGAAGAFPALALLGLERSIPAVMKLRTRSYSSGPNGIKFNKCAGEVLKEDEAGITRQVVELPDGLFDAGAFTAGCVPTGAPSRCGWIRGALPEVLEAIASRAFARGFTSIPPSPAISWSRIYSGLGAEVTPLGRSGRYFPVDTEAIRRRMALAAQWAQEHRFDAIVSADGDSDRPLISDEQGAGSRGDVTGVLCAGFWGPDSVSTPVAATVRWICADGSRSRRHEDRVPFVVSSMLDAPPARTTVRGGI